MKKALIPIIAGIFLFHFDCLSQKTLVGINGGIGLSNIYGHINGNDTRGDSRAGFTLGMVVDAPIGKTMWSFQPGLHYVQKGDFESKTPSAKTAIALRYAEFDLNFIHYTKGATKMYFGLGPYVGLNLPSKEVTITDNSRIETSLTFGKELADRYRGVDFGANGILGVRFKCNMTFAVNYAFGIRNLIPIPEGDNDVLRNGYLGFRLGYLFKNAPKK
jgi:hypothetical protein